MCTGCMIRMLIVDEVTARVLSRKRREREERHQQGKDIKGRRGEKDESETPGTGQRTRFVVPGTERTRGTWDMAHSSSSVRIALLKQTLLHQAHQVVLFGKKKPKQLICEVESFLDTRNVPICGRAY